METGKSTGALEVVTGRHSLYLFTSERLGFRTWVDKDLDPMAAINADPEVMEFFPSVQTRGQTASFMSKMQNEFEKNRFCYFAVDRLDTRELIGFTGLMEKTFESDFTPCIDIGWRLKRSEWNRGFATEAAKACLEYGFSELLIPRIFSMAAAVNTRSEHVMKKIGMKKVKNFNHPLLKGDKRLENCVLYDIFNPGHT